MIKSLTDADISWIKDLEYVFKYGRVSSPRGMTVVESLAYRSVVPMWNPIIFNEQRKLGYKFMAAEAAWILSGDNRVSTIAPYSKEISKFSDNGETFFGAYGPPVVNQIDYVQRVLQEDPDSRQAVMIIWRQIPPPTKDVPCTVSLQWLVRDGVMHCIATMRSSDLWLGHPYDIVNFSAISFYLMLRLNMSRAKKGDMKLVLGNLYLNAGSKHIYKRNADGVADVIEGARSGELPSIRYTGQVFLRERYDEPEEFIDHLWECANSDQGMLSMVFESQS